MEQRQAGRKSAALYKVKANKRKSRVFGVDIWVNVVTCSTVYRIFRGITDLTFCFLVTVACRNPARIQPSVVMTNDNRTTGVFTFRTFKVLTPRVDYRVQHLLRYEIANSLFSSNERFSHSISLFPTIVFDLANSALLERWKSLPLANTCTYRCIVRSVRYCCWSSNY